MNPVVVRKSAVHHVLLALAGALLVVAALDVMVLHRLSSPPEVDAETGEINSTGRTQQRSDLLWGSVLIVAGSGLVLVGTVGTVRRLPVAVISDHGLELRIAGPSKTVTIPWSEVAWVHSGSDGDDERVPTRVLLVHVRDRQGYPSSPWGAEWDGDTLMVDAANWTMRPADVVIHANVALDRWRRHHLDLASDDDLDGRAPDPATPGSPGR